MYDNEKQTGTAIKAFLASDANAEGLTRDDIHFTTKLARNSEYDKARKSISTSVKKSGLGYIDLFLLHSPYGGKEARLDSWRAVEDAIEAGEVKTGGVSNYGVKHVCETSDSSKLRLTDRTVEGAYGIEAPNPPRRESNRGSSIQHANGDYLVLSGEQHRRRSVCSAGQGSTDEAPDHCVTRRKVLVYSGSAPCPVESATWIRTIAEECHQGAYRGERRDWRV